MHGVQEISNMPNRSTTCFPHSSYWNEQEGSLLKGRSVPPPLLQLSTAPVKEGSTTTHHLKSLTFSNHHLRKQSKSSDLKLTELPFDY